MRSLTVFLLVAAMQLSAQSQPMSIASRKAAARLKLAPDTLLRSDIAGQRWYALDVENRLTVYSQTSGEVVLRSQLGTNDPQERARDFAVDPDGVVYLLAATGKTVSKWKPLAAGAEFTVTPDLDGPATAIAVDAEGKRIFVAASSRIWVLDGADGSVVEKGSATLSAPVTRVQFDPQASVLTAEGKNFLATLPLTLNRADVFTAASGLAAVSSNNVAAIYPLGFRLDPQVQTVNPGGIALLTASTILQDPPSGTRILSVDSPIPAILSRTGLTVPDAAQITINVPANQAPGVYRVVAKLDNGANGYSSAVIVVPFPGSNVIPMYGSGFTRSGPIPQGVVDTNYQIINPIDSNCATVTVADRGSFPVSNVWGQDLGASQWISGRFFPAEGCLPGLNRFRTNIDLREFDPTTANIAVSVLADNAVTLEINGTPIPSEPQPESDPELFRNPRAYAIPRETLNRGQNALDFVVRNDTWPGTTRNPMGLRVNVLHATAKPTVTPEPPPVGDFWLTLSPPFKFVNGTTAYFTVNINRVGGFAGTPALSLNELPPTGYSARFIGNVLEITRNLNVPDAPTTYRFSVLGTFSTSTRSVDGAFIQNALTPLDLALSGTGVLPSGGTAAAGTADANYRIIASPDAGFPGPFPLVADEATSPIGRWYPNDQFSRWISPRVDANNSNAPGVYRYRTTFDMGLGSPGAAAIALRWAADNDAKVYLNNVLVASVVAPDNFLRLNESLITFGFKQGPNNLDFEINNVGPNPSPQGLRVQIVGAQAARNPSRVVQVLRGLTAVGPTPLAPGAFTHNAPAGITITTNTGNLIFAASDAAPLGVTPVRIVFANAATLDVQVVVAPRESVPFAIASTGQADEGQLDPNYRMVESADMLFLPPNAYVILSNRSPVSDGIWVPNNINSRWIAPRTDAWLPNAPGVYRYRTTFDLTGRNPNNTMLALEWAADNRGRIELNGVIKDELAGPLGFQTMRPVSILSGFRAGINTIEFVVINDGPTVNPTGLHVNILGAFAVSDGVATGPDFSITADPGVRQTVPGGATTVNVRIVPNFTFTEVVNVSVVNPPAGFTFQVEAQSKYEFLLKVAVSPLVLHGQFPITIRGQWGNIIRDTQMRIDVGGSATELVVVRSTGQAAVGAVDPNYKLIDGGGGVSDVWVSNMDDSSVFWPDGPWIIPTPQKQNFNAEGTYRYRTTFTVSGADPLSIVIQGKWNADDTAIAYLNGQQVAVLYKPLPFAPGTLLIDRGFQTGVNTLDFVVTNTSTSPTGLMVQIESITAAPQ